VIGTDCRRSPQPALFVDMCWRTPQVMEDTRQRLRALALT